MTVRSCLVCGRSGEVHISSSGDDAVVHDEIDHAPGCILSAQPRHLARRRWQEQEKRANALLGARATIASGAIGEDGDGRSVHMWRIEAKRTSSNRYRLTQTVWGKLAYGAMAAGEEPVLHIEFHGASIGPFRVLVIRLDYYRGLVPEVPVEVEPRPSFLITDTTYLPRALPLHPAAVLIDEVTFRSLET